MPVYTGMCLPRSCPDTIISKYLNQTLNTIQSPLTIAKVNSKSDQYEFSLDWLSYLTITLMIIFGLATLTATVLGRCMKKKK